VEVLSGNRQVMLEVVRLNENDSIRLADPDGLLFSNVVLSEIFARLDREHSIS
jgi:hypothetical protein